MVCRSSLRALSEASFRSPSASGSGPTAPISRGLSAQSVSLHLRQLLVQERIRQLSIQTRGFSSSRPVEEPKPKSYRLDVETIKREMGRGVEFDRQTKQPTWVMPEIKAAASSTTVVPMKSTVRTPQEMTMEQNRNWRTRVAFYKDPYHFAKEIDRLIKKGEVEDALGMTRMASKDMDTVVPWGYLIGYYLEGHTIQQGIRLFNEMKKRKQMPSSKTYTTIFRSLSKSTHTSRAIREAVRIYIAMLNDTRNLPNTIHMNAVLEVCARGFDLDSLYAVAATADGGLRKPDSVTFTIMINAMRSYLEQSPNMLSILHEDSAEHMRGHVIPMIQKAKALWERVIEDWADGKIVMTEKLVCAFGRLLALGPWGVQIQVLMLLEHTMGIPLLLNDATTIATSKSSYTIHGHRIEALASGKQPTRFIRDKPVLLKAMSAQNKQSVDEFESMVDEADEHYNTQELDSEAEVSSDDLYSQVTSRASVDASTEDVLSNRTKKRLDQATRKRERLDRRLMKQEISTHGKPVSPKAIAVYTKLLKEGDDKVVALEARLGILGGTKIGEPTSKSNTESTADIIEADAAKDIEVDAAKDIEADAAKDIEAAEEEATEEAVVEEPTRVLEESLAEEAEPPTQETQEFIKSLQMPVSGKIGVLAAPGPNTLSLILRVLSTQRRTSAAARYWSLLTTKHSVTPDDENWRSYLFAQRRGHNSGNTAKLLAEMPAVRNHDIVTAMLCCLEDRDNPSSLAHASQIVQIMERELVLSPPSCLAVYTELIQRFYRAHGARRRSTGLRANGSLVLNKKAERALDAVARDVSAAVCSAADLFRKNQVDLLERCRPAAEGRPEREIVPGVKRAVVSSTALAQRLVGIVDRIIGDGVFKDETLMVLGAVKAKLARYLTEYNTAGLAAANGWAEWHDHDMYEKRRLARKEERKDAWREASFQRKRGGRGKGRGKESREEQQQ